MVGQQIHSALEPGDVFFAIVQVSGDKVYLGNMDHASAANYLESLLPDLRAAAKESGDDGAEGIPADRCPA